MRSLKKVISLSALAATTAIASKFPPTQYVSKSLAGLWPLRTNTLDSTMYKNDAFPFPEAIFQDSAHFTGNNYIEIPSQDRYSKQGNPGLTISFFFSTNTLNFSKTENNYVHFLGKGQPGEHEWTFRMYNKDSERPNRMSFYLFNPEGGLGTGSYVEEPITPGEWMFITAVVDNQHTYFYKNGVLKDKDDYTQGEIVIFPQKGNAPVRIGTRDFRSFINDAYISQLSIYSRALNARDVKRLYENQGMPLKEPPRVEFQYLSPNAVP